MSWLTTPLGPLALAFAGGIGATAWAPSAVWWALWFATAGATLAALALDRLRWAATAVLAGVLSLGALRGAPAPLAVDHIAHLALPRVGRVEARLAAEPVPVAEARLRVLLKVESVDGAPASGLIQLVLYGEAPPLEQGHRIAAEARLRRATGFHNPLGFDYAEFLARDGIHVVGSAAADRVEVLDAPPLPWHARVKRRAVEAIRTALPPVSGALLAGLLLGDTSGLPPDILVGFRRAGVYHVLAVSGFNVALLASSVFAVMRIVRAPRSATALAAMATVIGFAFVVGAEPSVLRAVIMAVLLLGALLLDRDAHVLNSLALAAILILAVRPGDLVDPGFQLSFAATAGIVLAPIPRGLVAGSLAVSLAAQLAVLPITLVHFNQVSTIGILANLGVVPLAAFATVVGLAGVALAFLSGAVATVAFDAVWPVLIVMRAIVRFAAATPGALVHFPAPHWAAVACYVASLGCALHAWRARHDRPSACRAGVACAFWLMVVACAIAAWPVVRPGHGRLRVSVLDVGTGDAIVVESPDRRTLLVDAGAGGPGRLDVGERVVAPFLWNHGILRLTRALTTHPHADHAGGMPAVRRLFAIDEKPGIVAAGAARWLGGVAVSTLHPLPSSAGPGAANDDAVVLRLDYGAASILLASDIGAGTERALLARGVAVGAAVLKVAHHGSRRSTTPAFLDAVRPAVAVISVGSRNPYGHPERETLERLRAAGARVYRTDEDGAVIVETDGRTLSVTGWASGRVDRYCLDPEADC